MEKIEPLVYDSNRFKLYTEDVIRELIEKANEIIDVVNGKEEKERKGGKRKGDE